MKKKTRVQILYFGNRYLIVDDSTFFTLASRDTRTEVIDYAKSQGYKIVHSM